MATILYYPTCSTGKPCSAPERMLGLNASTPKRRKSFPASWLSLLVKTYLGHTESPSKTNPSWRRGKSVSSGDLAAAVAAEDEDTAQAAVRLLEVEYEDLPVYTDPEEAC